MNENELRHALRATMATTTPPPPMSETFVLDAARLAERRRRARWAGVGSAAAAVLVVGTAVVVVAATSGAGGSDTGALQNPPTSTTTSATREQPTDTTTSWPNGQTDRTAKNGPEFDRGQRLLDELDASVPPGFAAPDDLVGTGDLAGAPMKHHQAQYADTVDGVEVWEYMADAAVTKGNKVGRLLAEVHTPGNGATGEACELAPELWGMNSGGCSEVLVDGKRVGVFDADDAEFDQFTQWAGYRYDDGTVVWIAQAEFRGFTNFPPLDGPPLTGRRLAELAADPRFHLD